MPRWQRMYLAACAGIIGYVLGYTVTDFARIPHLYYLPIERRWTLAAFVPGTAMGYVGQAVWGAVAGAVVALAAWAIAGRRAAAASDRALGLALAWTVTMFALCAGYFVWNNWP